jgi:hypothetical protein
MLKCIDPPSIAGCAADPQPSYSCMRARVSFCAEGLVRASGRRIVVRRDAECFHLRGVPQERAQGRGDAEAVWDGSDRHGCVLTTKQLRQVQDGLLLLGGVPAARLAKPRLPLPQAGRGAAQGKREALHGHQERSERPGNVVMSLYCLSDKSAKVDVDPVTGQFDPQPIVDRIKADQARVGKEKVSAPPKPVTWAYKPPESELEREEKMQAFEAAIDKSRFSTGELFAWEEVLTSDQKDFVWAVWKLFAEGDARLPLHRDNTRCVREAVRLMGSSSAFDWLAPFGKEWVGVVQQKVSA